MRVLLKRLLNYLNDTDNIFALLFGVLCGMFDFFGLFPAAGACIVCSFMTGRGRASSAFGVLIGIAIKKSFIYLIPLAISEILCIIWIEWLGDENVSFLDKILILSIGQLSVILFKHNDVSDCLFTLAACLVSIVLCLIFYGGIGAAYACKRKKVSLAFSQTLYLCLLLGVIVAFFACIFDIKGFSIAAILAGLTALVCACMNTSCMIYAMFAVALGAGFSADGFSVGVVTAIALAAVVSSLFKQHGKLPIALIYACVSSLFGIAVTHSMSLIDCLCPSVFFLLIPEKAIRAIEAPLYDTAHAQRKDKADEEAGSSVKNKARSIARATAGLQKAIDGFELKSDGSLAVKQLKAVSVLLDDIGNNEAVQKKKLISVQTGMACVPKPGCAHTGDSVLITDNELITVVAVSDGMGSGLLAHNESSAAVEVFTEMINAGFGISDSVDAVNRRLLFKCRSDFYATLDAIMIDKAECKATFVKMGAPSSFLIRDKRVHTICSESLPIGIVESVKPTVEKLELKDGDLLLVITDGVTDALGSSLLADIVDLSATKDTPEQLANALLDEAMSMLPDDDMSIVCVRIAPGEN